MAISASKGAVEVPGCEEAGFVRSLVEEERRSVAEVRRPPVELEEDWIWEEAYMLGAVQ